MLYNCVNIETIAYTAPPEIITSDDIETQLAPTYERLRLPVGRLELMTGIKERRLWKRGMMPSTAATLAGQQALSQSNFPKEKIGCLINCSVCRDFLEPATATIVHKNLSLPPDSQVFDISNACLGILSGMTVVASMIEAGHIEAGMLVAGENSRPLLESTIAAINADLSLTRQTIKPLFASLTIGSGAVAVILSHRDSSMTSHRLNSSTSLAATEYNDLCRGNSDKGMADNHDTLMETDSEALLNAGVETAVQAWERFNTESPTNDDFDCFCTHQVGNAHRRLLYDKLQLDITRDFPTLAEFGNTGSVSCPMTAARAIESGIIQPGSTFALLGIGSGINATMMGISW
ncbi:MAG: 3-oxoacyl-ACP synthase III [Victivallaceae bacterium]|nr:3-oxoacyl-ACP synthase III [Victivallaceae bacterium]